jgi:hypothetical protein
MGIDLSNRNDKTRYRTLVMALATETEAKKTGNDFSFFNLANLYCALPIARRSNAWCCFFVI